MTDTQTQLDQDLAETTEPQPAVGNGASTAMESAELATSPELPVSSATDGTETIGSGDAPAVATAEQASGSTPETVSQDGQQAASSSEEPSDDVSVMTADATVVAEQSDATDGLTATESPVDEQVIESNSEPTEQQVAEESRAEPETIQPATESPAEPAAVEAAIDPASPEAAAAPVAAEPPAATEDEPQRLARLEERGAALAEEVKAAPNRATFLGRVRRLMGQVPEELGEQAAALRGRLADLEREILEQIEERRTLKEAIVVRAEALAGSNEWKATGEAMRGLFERWKEIGSAGHDAEDALWQRFQAARDAFSQRRNEWFEGRQKEWAANREKKEALCIRAEELSESTEWRQTADAMRGLMAEWKTVGSAGRESDDALWSRFRGAQQVFFDRRSATYDENRRRKEELCAKAEELRESTDWRETADALKGLQAGWKDVGPVGNRDLEDQLWNRFRGATQAFFDRRGSSFAERDRDETDNLRRKEELCVAAEALAVAADPVAATEEAKALQAEWKTIGPVRRDRGDALWARFRGACDRVFENSVNERARRQVAWSSKMREALERKEEQLARLEEAVSHDEATVQRWQASLATRPDDGVAAKIADTTARIAEKRTRAADLKASIDDIRVKMGS
ncbi:MAG: hypothetical protein QOF33_2295 [Thermomicrobiales bacterium]|nr:hypothetical protein [Thermomicrobiales bacterium]